ncbi:dockerin type I domain-containing protein, partial [Roseateles sp. P5_E11]
LRAIEEVSARSGRRLAALLALAGAALCCPAPALAHNDGAYWHDSGPAAHNPQWMLTLGATKKLTELSLPGTHDSGTFHGVGGPIAQTQTMTIREQLDSGIRYLDIRLKYYDLLALQDCNQYYQSSNCALLVFHGGVDMFLPFESGVLQPTVAFLKSNPSELVIMSVVMETADCKCDPAPALDALLDQPAVIDGVATGQKYADYLLPATCPGPATLTLGPVPPLNSKPDPNSCDARGKVLLTHQYMGPLSTRHYYRPIISMGYTAVLFDKLRSNLDLYHRLWLPVKSHLADAANITGTSQLYYVGSGGSDGGFPYFFASGHSSAETGAPRLSTGLVDGATADAFTFPDFPRTACALGLCTISYEGMNTLIADYVMRPQFHLPGSRIGIIRADFPGSRFITAVASVNAGVTFNRPTFGYTLVTSDSRPYTPGTWTNRQVVITPQCDVVCIGNRAVVSEDTPNGFSYTLTGGGYSVSFTTSPVRVDLKPPTIKAAATTQPGAAGWYTGDVVVRFTCADTGGSGVAVCPDDLVLSKQGTVSSGSKYAVDVAGNKSDSSNIVTVKIDKTPPAVVYRGNLGSYAPGQSVDITCEAMDKESGVASTNCADIRGLASSFGPGSHRYSAIAADVAGNTGMGAATFTVVALPGDVNFDGAIDCRDQAVVKTAFGKRAGMPGFDARADVNGDGVVDIRDLAFIAQKLAAGTTCP